MKDESPYTKVPNSIFDIEGLNIYERLILLFIVRKTIGFNKKSDGISLSQFVKFTGASKPTVLKAIENLKKMKCINVLKQTNSTGGKHYNRYTPLVNEIDYLVKQIDKGSKGGLLGLVKQVDIQEENNTKENIQKREREIDNIYFSLSDNEQLKETDRYIKDLISESEYLKSQKGFSRKIKKQLANGDDYQLEDFEKWYLSKTCEELKDKYVGKYYYGDVIENIYPYFDTEAYNPNSKFIIWLIRSGTKKGYSKCFSDRHELYQLLDEVVDGII